MTALSQQSQSAINKVHFVPFQTYFDSNHSVKCNIRLEPFPEERRILQRVLLSWQLID